MDVKIIIAICVIVLILIILLVLVLGGSPSWEGSYKSDMNPGEIFKITIVDSTKVTANGTTLLTSGDIITGYGTRGKLTGNKIIWENGNIWHKI